MSKKKRKKKYPQRNSRPHLKGWTQRRLRVRRERAIRLYRERGLSLAHIGRVLGVSRQAVFTWVTAGTVR